MDKERLSFAVCLINEAAQVWGILPSQVYKRLNSVGYFERYLIPHYDVLHTQGMRYLIDDAEEYLARREQRA